ncbi:uncharacterized protein RBU57_012766 [Macrochelys suwanniensis]
MMQSSSAEVTMQSQNRKRAPAWTEREVLDLIAVWGDESVLAELQSKRRNAKISKKIAKAMMERGYSRDATQCRVKIKELRQAYQKTKESNGRSGSDPQTCRFYAALHAILGGDATTTPPMSVDSEDGVFSSLASSEVFADREDDDGDDEDEVVDSTLQGNFPESQELFLTLTEIPSQPSQGSIPDREAREGTSAATVPRLPPASPSQRLSQIRRRKKRTYDEMFSELTETARQHEADRLKWELQEESRRKENLRRIADAMEKRRRRNWELPPPSRSPTETLGTAPCQGVSTDRIEADVAKGPSLIGVTAAGCGTDIDAVTAWNPAPKLRQDTASAAQGVDRWVHPSEPIAEQQLQTVLRIEIAVPWAMSLLAPLFLLVPRERQVTRQPGLCL